MIGDTLAGVVDVVDVVDLVLGLAKQCSHVVIVQGVPDHISAPPKPNGMLLTRKAHLVGDS